MSAAAIDFEALFHALPTPFMVLDADLRFVEMNQAYLDTTQRTREELLGRFVFDAFPESGERLERFERAFRDAVVGKGSTLVKVPFSVPRPESEGGGFREIWWTCSHVPIRDTDGNFGYVLQHARDITAEVESERVKEMVSGELQHRVRNIFAMVSTIARRTADYETDIDGYVRSFTGRINALTETHSMLTGGNWDGMELGDLVRRHLEIYSDAADGSVRLEGPELRLSAREAQSISMAVHELATNAAKYGALNRPEGRLEVRWSNEPGSGYAFEWREDGLSNVVEPSRAGFGSLILTRFLPGQLEAEARQEFAETGYVYSLRVPRRHDSGSEAP